MFKQKIFRSVASTCRRIGESITDIVYLIFAICVEIADRFDRKE